MRLLVIRPDVADTWFSNPDKFRKDWTPDKIRKTVFSSIPQRAKNYANFYWSLCDYTHPSFKGWYELFKQQKDVVLIGFCPEFNQEYASECIGLICFGALQSVEVYTDFFKEWLDNKVISEANALMPKVFNIVQRHFKVRKYNKKGLLRKQI